MMKLPRYGRYITYRRGARYVPYVVRVYRDGKARYVGSYPTLKDATEARNDYCGVHGLEINETRRNKSSNTR